MTQYAKHVKEVDVNRLKIYIGIRGKGDTADAYYRARAPWSVCEHFAPDEFEMTMGTLTDATLDTYDVVWAQRPNSAEEEIILRMAKSLGKPIIVDIDDDLFDIPPSAGDIFDHYHYRGKAKWSEQNTLNVKKPLAHHQRCLSLADVITVPTLRLAEAVEIYIPGVQVFRELPNYILWGDWDWLPDTLVGNLGLSIGWFGHFYHSHDLQWVAPVLDRVTREVGAKLVVMGQPEAIELFPQALAENTYVEDIVSFSGFQSIRRLLKTLDVGICPLMDIRFNRGKSWVKALQFGAAGVAPVCSGVVYDQVPELVELGLVAGDLEDFERILLELLGDEEKRGTLAWDWREEVRRRHTYESLAFELDDGRMVPNAMRWLELAKEVANGQ